MTPNAPGESPAVVEMRERLGALGWGLVARRNGDGIGYLAYRISSTRSCKTLEDVQQLAIALECHARAAARKGGGDERMARP
jgi:hypothetical protein